VVLPVPHRQSGVWHEAGFVDFGPASCTRELPRLRARNAPTWPSEAQGTKPEVLYSLNSYSPAWVRAFPNFLEKTEHDEWVRAPYKWEKRGLNIMHEAGFVHLGNGWAPAWPVAWRASAVGLGREWC